MQKKDDYSNILKHNSLKSTRHRIEILKNLEQNDQPIAAEQVYFELREKGISINISSVYRILEALVTRNLVLKSSIGEDNRALFELNRMTHKHRLICVGCKKMFSIEGCPLMGYEKMLQESIGFEVTGHKLEIYGYCRNCSALNKST